MSIVDYQNTSGKRDIEHKHETIPGSKISVTAMIWRLTVQKNCTYCWAAGGSTPDCPRPRSASPVWTSPGPRGALTPAETRCEGIAPSQSTLPGRACPQVEWCLVCPLHQRAPLGAPWREPFPPARTCDTSASLDEGCMRRAGSMVKRNRCKNTESLCRFKPAAHTRLVQRPRGFRAAQTPSSPTDASSSAPASDRMSLGGHTESGANPLDRGQRKGLGIPLDCGQQNRRRAGR